MFPPRPQGEDSASIAPPPHLLPLLPPTSVRSKKLLHIKAPPVIKETFFKGPAAIFVRLFCVFQPCRCVRAQTKQAPRLWTFRVIGGGGVGRGGEGGSFWTGPSALAPFTSPTAVKLHRSNQRPSALQMCEEPLLDLPGVAGSFYSLWWKNICRVLMWLDPGFILRPGSRRSQASCKSSLGFCFWQQR